MAANWWTSSQRKIWTFETDRLADMREDLETQHEKLISQYPYPDRRLMFIFLKDRLSQLAKRLQSRQQCIATALVYIQRYFLSHPMQNVNLYVLTATALYLASKTEEHPHHIRLVVSEARNAWPEFVPGDVSRLGEMEFCLISEMRSQLIIWHPYRTLLDLKEKKDLKLNDHEVSLAWWIINDSYMTDLPLTCPPHLIAVIAAFLAIVFFPSTRVMPGRQMSSDFPKLPDTGSFPSLANNSTIGTGLGGALQSMPMNPPARPATNGHQANGGTQQQSSDQSNLVGSDRATTIAKIQSSERFQSIIKFLVDSELDLKQMTEGTQEIISLYAVWEEYNEKTIKEAVSKCLKFNSFDN